MENNEKPKTVVEMKAESIRLIAGAKCYLLIADDGSLTDRRMVLDNPMSALALLREMEVLKSGILFAKQTPPPSSIIKT
jgi:hypothetical protein